MMDKLTKIWHKVIISQAEEKLGRGLFVAERNFVESRLGYIALELIENSVRELRSEALAEYLNSENPGQVDE